MAIKAKVQNNAYNTCCIVYMNVNKKREREEEEEKYRNCKTNLYLEAIGY